MVQISETRVAPQFSELNTRAIGWLAVLLFAVWCETAGRNVQAVHVIPVAWTLRTADWINQAFGGILPHIQWIFRAIAALIALPLSFLQAALAKLPWSVIAVAITLIAFRAGGHRLALITSGSVAYIIVLGYWTHTMNTVASVLIGVPIAVTIGFAFGVMGYVFVWGRPFVMTTLDLMQTVPTFSYLIPILLLFGFGPVVGIIASAIYAIGPMAQNTLLGLKRVPASLREAGEMSGCTRSQLFWHVEVRAALGQILVGVNQAVMAIFAMVIIAAVIGGSDDIGWQVLTTMRKAQFGESLLCGGVIALLAIMMDRITTGFACGKQHSFTRKQFLAVFLAGLAFAFLAAQIFPELDRFPAAWHYNPSEGLNAALRAFIANFGEYLATLKNAVLFFVLLPLRVGLVQAISPFTWGITFTPELMIGYWAVSVILAFLSWLLFRRLGICLSVLFLAWLLYFGTTGVAWPAFILVVTMLALTIGGLRLAAFVLLALLFIAASGAWSSTMQSLYLCTVAVILSCLCGGAIGILAGKSDRVSFYLRPMLDTLQTMPQFVLLIPALMLFQVGEFTALIAIVLYAIVMPIRYFEHGIRSVPPEIVEAARQMGCSGTQQLFHVELPIAWPVIMLGLNQTILASLGMLSIAAMVGAQGLAQDLYVALSKANVGLGMVAGLSIALVALISDRMIQTWSRRRSSALGL
ncbi:proline/glycine betaine ABC transporter permease [Hyphomicrobium sp.]|uniref:ABC transporter permease n=1 Tax=Hyphomicrobium sp. TaxID=82 RepID=UPI0025C0C729|nr:ABC transporter permease subunit [Hyphomicrobium sp.]